MSLKGVELQIAIPKTFEAGKIAEQHQQNNLQQQLNAHEELKKQLIKRQSSVNESESTDTVTSDGEQQDSSKESSEQKSKKESKKEKEHHPFKGNFVDYSG